MRLCDCGQVAASALFYTISRRCQGGGAALESGVSTELGWLRGMGDKVGPKTLSETVPHRARNHKTRRAHKAPLLYKAVVEPRAVERLSVWSTTDARGRIVRLRVGGQGQAVRRGGRTCRRLRCGCLACCNSRRERWVVPCAVAPPIRLTGGRVLDRCVKHTEEPTHLSEDTLLCLRPSHSAVMPSVLNVPPSYSSTPQSWFLFKLREQT